MLRFVHHYAVKFWYSSGSIYIEGLLLFKPMSLFSHILLKGLVAFFWGRVLWGPVMMYCVLCMSAAPALSTWDTWKCSEENWGGISHTLPGWGCQRCCTCWKDVGLWLVWRRYFICVIPLWRLKIYFDHASEVFVLMMLYDLCVAWIPYYWSTRSFADHILSLFFTHILSYLWFRSDRATTIAAKASSCPSLGTSVQTCEEGWMQ